MTGGVGGAVGGGVTGGVGGGVGVGAPDVPALPEFPFTTALAIVEDPAELRVG
ncbi:MAG TPA: hypothetical protein VNF75_01565 [Candidatus Dormibacteraeota bacterium]|nr:hypothetical protein [Candidatus Dormibacteraeota bacterium]